jgi:hypothetical protein
MPSCAVSLDDLKNLFDILTEKVREAAEIDVSDRLSRIRSLPGLSPENLDPAIRQMEEQVRASYRLVIQVFGKGGEVILSESNSVLSNINLPNEISSILIDSTIPFKARNNNQLPPNGMSILIDFNKPNLLDPVLSSQSTPNNGNIEVYGNNETWVDGVFNRISAFLKPKRKRRDWLHTNYIYDFLLFVLGLPLSFWAVYKINQKISSKIMVLPEALQITVYVFIVLVALRIFLFIFGYSRWLFPIIELEGRIQSVSKKHRLIYGTVILSIISMAAYDFIKLLFI